MYKDIDFKFKTHPVTGSTMVSGIESINQALTNIMNTTRGERIGDPNFGSNIKAYLFEKINYVTAANIRNELLNITAFEPRIIINSIEVIPNYDHNQYDIIIDYSVNDVQGSTVFGINLSVQE